MKNLIIFLIFIFLGLTSYTQNNFNITQQECYGGSEVEYFCSITATDNGYLVLSETSSNDGDIQSGNHGGGGDFWLLAIDSLGTLLWEKCYGGTGRDTPTCIISDNNGCYYLGGWTGSDDGDVQSGNHGSWDRWVVKIDSLGNIIWERCYGGSGSDYPSTFLLLDNGNILVYSATTSNDGDVPVNYGYLDVWLTIINPEGEIIQNKVFGNSHHNNIFDIVQTVDGGFFFTSKASSTDGMVEGELHGDVDIWAVKIDSLFNIEWQKLYGGSHLDYQGWGIIELEDGYFFLGNTDSNDGDVSGFHGIPGELSTDDIWAVRIDLTGNIVWQRCLGGSKTDIASVLFQTDDGGFVIFAQTSSHNGDVISNNSTYEYDDIWMVKLSADGEVLSSQCYGGKKSEPIFNGGAVKKSDDNFVIAGITKQSTGDVECDLHGQTDIWLFEIKDCTQYQPQTPNQPTGPDTLCYTTDSTSMYAINAAAGAWGYEWKIEPEQAGTILQDSLLAYVTWNQQYEGEVAVSARSYNDCGESDWSIEKLTWVYNCVGINEIKSGNVLLRVFPNPTKSSFEIQCSIFEIQKSIIEIFDIYGRKVKESNLPKGQTKTEINIKKLKRGIYFIKVQFENGALANAKVLVE